MNKTVLEWLNESSIKFFDKILYKDEDRCITFGEFDIIRKSVGTYLLNIAEQGSPIAVMTGRNVYTPACFLGVASAGCFYAPMDPTMPIARLNRILNVIQSDYLLVDRQNEETARSLDFSGEIIVFEDIMQTSPDDVLLKKVASDLVASSPLYVIFTSGSTGNPKGVVTSHHALMCYIDDVCSVLNIDDSDVLGSQSPLDYVAAIRDIYIPLKTGASTVIIPKNEFSMPSKLFDRLNKNKVTALCWSVSGVELPAKLNAFSLGKPQYLKKLCFSGSVINCKYLKVWMDNLPDVLYVNQYGPTEATASCTYYVLNSSVKDDSKLPIGVPYNNYKILLLNEDLTETPNGEIGEICVGGPALSLGYYGDIQKTNEVFIQNPLNDKYRETIYKTGDLGRFNSDGNIEFVGRKDRQIKHLGHRIELDEIEETAKRIQGISECCALYIKEKEQLCLFYSGNTSSKEIVLYFRNVMPSFMVPRKTIQLESIPKLPNGKTDMKKLETYFNGKG